MPDTPTGAHIGLGSNLGDREANLTAALDAIARLEGTRLRAVSPLIETRPVGPAGQGLYLNGAAAIETTLPARELLDRLLAIERALGRTRRPGERWGPRTIDLDLLLYGGLVMDEPGLTVPHPRMHERRFVLEPLAAIAPDAIHPILNERISDLLDTLTP